QAIAALERGIRRRPYPSTLDLLARALELSSEQREVLFEAGSRRRRRPQTGGGGAARHAPHLPLPPTPLVDREREQRQAADLLRRPDVRLLTITGTAGVGKTHLALACGAAAAPDHPDGAFLVSLSPVSDPDHVGATIGRSLGLDTGGRALPSATLAAHIGARRVLVVADNLEQLTAATPLLSDLLASCPGLRLLVTSRSPLRIRGEHLLPVRPLAVPAAGRDAGSVEALATVPAVALFAARARAHLPAFELTPGNAATVAEICRRLDGLPLALELAAAWVKRLSPEALLERLADRFQVLVGGPYDLAPHQRTMRSTLRWSYDLLPEDQRALFRRLSVFEGDIPLDAISRVGRAAGPLDVDVLEAVAGLADSGLLRSTPAGCEPRLRMLETIRAYASELLRDENETEATLEALHQHYRRIARATV
ncbi:MAG TPA: AfsR/SARP family transcriptional regulator, partial [Candidatus Dormibacteraeota bacterium]|nr:AfsR/SARP family transcriptional regulator [Candidatus Dormibacteraeota bacterium]